MSTAAAPTNNRPMQISKASACLGGICVALVVTLVLAVGLGAVQIPAGEVIAILARELGAGTWMEIDSLHASVVTGIRLPRVCLGMLVGAGLGISGALMQGVFRNPLADPGLIGVSSGAALAASMFIVLGDNLVGLFGVWVIQVGTPLCAFVGALSVTAIVWKMGTVSGRVAVARLLLAGIAVNALAGALIGLLTLVATDSELRDLTFWSLGSLNAATWITVGTALLGVAPVLVVAPRLAQSLDAWLLGEAEASHLGVDTNRLKRWAVASCALAVGAAVAVSGIIGFVGLVIPHLIRMVLGPSHRHLLVGSALLGAWVLMLADVLARMLIAPVEIPIGLVTALGGSPFFLLLLQRSRLMGGFA